MSRRNQQSATADDWTLLVIIIGVLWFAMVGFGCWFSGDCGLAWWEFFLD